MSRSEMPVSSRGRVRVQVRLGGTGSKSGRLPSQDLRLEHRAADWRGRYISTGVVTRGKTIDVLVGLDPDLARRVMLYRLHGRRYANTPLAAWRLDQLRRFSSLSSPGWTSIYEVWSDHAELWAVGEYYEGLSLREYVAKSCHHPSQIVALATQAADALVDLHRCGLAHGQLTVSSMRVGEDGVLKIVDCLLGGFWQQRGVYNLARRRGDRRAIVSLQWQDVQAIASCFAAIFGTIRCNQNSAWSTLLSYRQRARMRDMAAFCRKWSTSAYNHRGTLPAEAFANELRCFLETRSHSVGLGTLVASVIPLTFLAGIGLAVPNGDTTACTASIGDSTAVWNSRTRNELLLRTASEHASAAELFSQRVDAVLDAWREDLSQACDQLARSGEERGADVQFQRASRCIREHLDEVQDSVDLAMTGRIDAASKALWLTGPTSDCLENAASDGQIESSDPREKEALLRVRKQVRRIEQLVDAREFSQAWGIAAGTRHMAGNSVEANQMLSTATTSIAVHQEWHREAIQEAMRMRLFSLVQHNEVAVANSFSYSLFASGWLSSSQDEWYELVGDSLAAHLRRARGGDRAETLLGHLHALAPAAAMRGEVAIARQAFYRLAEQADRRRRRTKSSYWQYNNIGVFMEDEGDVELAQHMYERAFEGLTLSERPGSTALSVPTANLIALSGFLGRSTVLDSVLQRLELTSYGDGSAEAAASWTTNQLVVLGVAYAGRCEDARLAQRRYRALHPELREDEGVMQLSDLAQAAALAWCEGSTLDLAQYQTLVTLAPRGVWLRRAEVLLLISPFLQGCERIESERAIACIAQAQQVLDDHVDPSSRIGQAAAHRVRAAQAVARRDNETALAELATYLRMITAIYGEDSPLRQMALQSQDLLVARVAPHG